MPARQVEDSELEALAEVLGWNAYAIAKHLGLNHSPVARRMRNLVKHKAFPELPSVTPNSERYVITCAVSGSEVNQPFLDTLNKYCKATGSQLLVLPLRYRNPTSQRESPDDWFDPALVKHLCHGRHTLHKHLMLMGDVPIQPTAVKPLSSLATMTGIHSAIYPHPKIALESIATGPNQHAKLIMTTGAVTLPEYSISKAGIKGQFHHICGAAIVEIDGDKFHIRHINSTEDGSFHHLDRKWSAKGPKQARAAAITLGDLHAGRHDPRALEASLDMIKTLKPEYVILEDVLDCYSVSPHNSYFESYRLHQNGKGDIEQEIREVGAVLATIAKAAKGAEVIIVDSNHHDHLSRWLLDKNNAHDTQNGLFYHWCKTAVLAGLKYGREAGAFEIALREFCPKLGAIRFLKPNESLNICGVEHSWHGHRGPNGARGSIASFTKVAAKVTIGHSHSPGIQDGVYQTGTVSLLDLGYNRGSPSSWCHTNAVLYQDGKRALLHIIKGEWRKK